MTNVDPDVAVPQVIEVARTIVERDFPSCSLDVETGDDPRLQGFAFIGPGDRGTSLVVANAQGAETRGGWWLQYATGLASEVEHIGLAREWCNDRNATSVMGKYYAVAAHHERSCTVIWEQQVWSGVLLGLWTDAQGQIIDWLSVVAQQAQRSADEDARQVLKHCGGRPFPCGGNGPHLLVVTACG